MLDVHVIISSDTPRAWVTRCVSSIRLAMGRAGFPMALHQVDGRRGHIGAGRALGYAQGDYPWVTCVDDDDLVLPNAFADMAPCFRHNVDAVGTLEIEMRNDSFRTGGHRHHLTAYRRSALIDHSAWACCGDVAQVRAIADGRWRDVPNPGYLWRVYEGSKARALRHANPDELVRANG